MDKKIVFFSLAAILVCGIGVWFLPKAAQGWAEERVPKMIWGKAQVDECKQISHDSLHTVDVYSVNKSAKAGSSIDIGCLYLYDSTVDEVGNRKAYETAFRQKWPEGDEVKRTFGEWKEEAGRVLIKSNGSDKFSEI
jgi:hypothetical protein